MTASVWFLAAFVLYTALLFGISSLSSRKAGSSSFFSGDRKAPWPVVAYGMIGSSISGVSFISVPGNVWVQNFFYMPLVLGFVVGYIIIAKVLLPLYYKMELTSIYTYLGGRFGRKSYMTGTTVFMVSRILGAAVRIFVVIVVLYTFIPESLVRSLGTFGTYAAISVIFLGLLYLYTYKGGVKTIIWTDVMQTTVMLLAIGMTIWFICRDMGWNFSDMIAGVGGSVNPNEGTVGFGKPFTSWFDWDWSHGTNTVKQFISGIFVTVAMSGLDQAMMQKNLACKNLKAAQKNIYTSSVIIVAVNLFFVLLGALLSVYAYRQGGFDALGIIKTDQLYPTIASRYLGTGVGVLFLIGLISASYPSAGAAVTSLTTSFCVDYLGFGSGTPVSADGKPVDEKHRTKVRHLIQAAVTVLFLLIILVLCAVSNDAVVNLVYKLASYTYGPLLGMFFYGILTGRQVRDGAVPYIAAISPLLCLGLNLVLRSALHFDLGFSLLIVNSLLSFAGMHIFSRKS
ncbi:MAG: sodium:solute symporter [Bacteroidales bacterium]|nr:sodium:solute symporter [Bacteroidales bacterium]